MNVRLIELFLATAVAGVPAWLALAASGGDGLPAALGCIQPRLAPDGRTIAVSYQGAIGVLPAAGGRLRVLTSEPGYDVDPAWTPDGRHLLYVNSPNLGEGALRRIEARRGKSVALPAAVRASGPLYVHPDGSRILGRFSTDRSPLRLAWCRLADGQVEPISGITPRGRFTYALSPDGGTWAVADHQDIAGQQTGNDGPQADVWTLPAGGGAPVRRFRFPARVYNLTWEPDARGLILVSDLGVSHYDLWRVDLADPDRTATRWTLGMADEDSPSFSAGGRLAYTDNRAGATTLMLGGLRDGEFEASPVRVSEVEFSAPAGLLELDILDRAAAEPCAARVSVQRQGGKFHAPPGALHRHTTGLGHFYARGRLTWKVPAGTYVVTLFRGHEYREWRREVGLTAGKSLTVRAELERWTDAGAAGWYSGENHVHANYGYGAWYNTPPTVLDQCEGEDLNVCNVVVANSDGDGVYDREFFRGGPDGRSTRKSILYWNQEFRSTLWGHMTLFNLRQLVEPIFTGFKDTTHPYDVPTNGDVADRTHVQGAGVSYTHPAGNRESPYDGAYSAKGLPVDAALGKIDTLDVMGFGYDATLDLWYRFLNCGFRLPAAAGTDCFLNRISSFPPGWGRCYVRMPEGLTYAGWVIGQQAGRSYITKGAELRFRAAAVTPGGTLQVSQPGSVSVSAQARAQYPLDRLEVLVNGVVVATARPGADPLRITLDQTVPIPADGWIAARVYGSAPSYYPGGSTSAHTNPIWVRGTGVKHDPSPDARYFLAWIDRLEGDLRRRARVPQQDWPRVQAQLDGARQVYRRLAGG